MSKIELIVTNNYDEMSQKAADIFVELLKRKPNATLGLATGSTPIGLYKKLIEKNKAKEISFKNVITCIDTLFAHYVWPKHEEIICLH